MSKQRTKELLELTIESLSHDMNSMRNSKIKRNRANEALAKITQIQIDLDLIYPSSFEKVDMVTPGDFVGDGSNKVKGKI